jgi:tetratricopeptide (TPR) repeat protein
MANLANVYVAHGRYGEAESHYKRALEIIEKSRGANFHEVGAILNSLGNLYTHQDRYAEAEQLYKRGMRSKLRRRVRVIQM